MNETAYWVALSRVPEFGARRIRKLVEHFGSAKAAFFAAENEFAGVGLPARVLSAFIVERTKLDPDAELRRVTELGFKIVTLADGEYPSLLREIYDPPAILFYRGDLEVLCQPCLAVVGSRRATEYGRTAAVKLATELARAGTVVVSGMARGIDTCAHTGALKAGGKTVAVLGCGLDICYPPENRRLRDEIAERGLLLSEFPPGTEPKPPHFPMRNRIISGLSLATVVVEAEEKSGALITADCALEQGREVFAVPGSINSPNSRGCHRLLKDGAAIVEGAADILEELGLATMPVVDTRKEPSPLQKQVLTAMEYEPLHFDELLRVSKLETQVLAAALAELEINEWVRKLPGNYYLRV